MESLFTEAEKLTIANAVGELMAEATYLNMLGIPACVHLGASKSIHCSVYDVTKGECVQPVPHSVWMDGTGAQTVDEVVSRLTAASHTLKHAAAAWLESQQEATA
ncbi:MULTISPECIES: hypothetical protein [unclassified Halobacteriovorax]|uniref:hypothetical protein n=1 Tax=unclassified Halobacteriovorax TaxID=2639665 RepID=UPI00399BD470